MRLIKLINDFIVFIFIFSMFNDNFLVDILGANILKVIMVIFIITNIGGILNGFAKSLTGITRTFLILFVLLLISMLLVELRDLRVDLVSNIFLVVAIFVIFYYFAFYKDIEKILYFIWFSVMSSIVICYFNKPISPWTFRTTGGTGDPNEFAAQVVSFIFVSIYLYTRNKNLPFLLSSLIFGSYALLKAGSKSAVLTLIILLLYIGLVRYRENLKTLLSIKSMLVALLLVGAFIKFDVMDIKLIKDFMGRTHSTATAEMRYMSWRSGWEMVKHNFWFGVGMGAFAEHNPKYLKKGYLDKSARAAHNIYVKLFAESGALTFVAFLLFVGVLFKTHYFQIIHSDYFWLQASTLSYLIMGFTLGIFYDKYFWLSLAVYTNIVNTFREPDLEAVMA